MKDKEPLLPKEYTIDDLRKVAEKGQDIDNIDYVNLSNSFRRDFLKLYGNPDKEYLLSFNAVALRIMLRIIAEFRNKTFIVSKEDSSSEASGELAPQDNRNTLNEQEFEQFLEDERDYILSYKVSDFVPNREQNRLLEGLIWLTNYKRSVYKITTKTGKEIKTYGGFLNRFWVDEKMGLFYVQVNSYWIKQLVDLSANYALIFLIHFNSLKNIKKIIFLMTIAEMNIDRPMRYSLEKLNSYFNFNYRYASQLVNSFLKPIKDLTDKPIPNITKNQYSFNYKIDNNDIWISKYLLKPKTNITSPGKTNLKTETKQDFTFKMAYYKKRHRLSDDQMTSLKKKLEPIKKGEYYIERELFKAFKEAYELFIKDCRTYKVAATNYQGVEFLSKIKEFLSDDAKNYF